MGTQEKINLAMRALTVLVLVASACTFVSAAESPPCVMRDQIKEYSKACRKHENETLTYCSTDCTNALCNWIQQTMNMACRSGVPARDGINRFEKPRPPWRNASKLRVDLQINEAQRGAIYYKYKCDRAVLCPEKHAEYPDLGYLRSSVELHGEHDQAVSRGSVPMPSWYSIEHGGPYQPDDVASSKP